VELRLSVRAFKPGVRDLLEKRIREIAQAQAAVFGASAEVIYTRSYPPLVNDAKHAEFCRQVVRDWLGPDGLDMDWGPETGSEDFAFFLEKIPGCYVLIGNGDSPGQGTPDGVGCMLHNSGYDFNDAALSTGASFWTRLVEAYLPRAG
jgi:hippurate hydrolase